MSTRTFLALALIGSAGAAALVWWDERRWRARQHRPLRDLGGSLSFDLPGRVDEPDWRVGDI